MKLSKTAFNCLLLIKWKIAGERNFGEGLSLWEPLENKRGEGVKNPRFLRTLFMNGPLDNFSWQNHQTKIEDSSNQVKEIVGNT